MVLEARENADKVWYPVVWEDIKDASNVIDYDIREEETIEQSSVFDANNDTTTGMANVIPWVNSPKLIQSTSIYDNSEWANWWVTASWQATLRYPDDLTSSIRIYTLSDQYWNIPFKIKTDWVTVWWNWIVIPNAWWYELYIGYPIWSSTNSKNVDLYIAKWWRWNDILIHHYTWQKSSTHYYWTVNHYFNAWDILYARVELDYIGSSSSFTSTATLTIQITKL